MANSIPTSTFRALHLRSRGNKVTQGFREEINIDDLLGLQLADALVDLGLDLVASIRVSRRRQKRAHGLEAFITRTRARARILGDVRDVAIEALVFAQPVADQATHVAGELGRVGRITLVGDAAALEALDERSLN